ncbi:NPC intracellular cholesterol transporter 1-like isoform X1 [Montipora foliosa]|uniref:NPC intracellular cholesterol transporter 1-like isoform X1 n=1 Tax=Montipora foliosa TaxID=591990 RepID=UPI0035F1648C
MRLAIRNIQPKKFCFNAQKCELSKVKSEEYAKYHKKGYCVWYGQCSNDYKPKNCFYNGPAKELKDPEGVKLLNSICPELRGQRTCCDTKQLKSLVSSLQTMRQLTSRCPACWNNMRRLYCVLTCNKDQSVFLDPTSIDNKTILSISYFVSEKFKQGLYDSCKDVTFPEFNEKVMKLLCGTPAETCSPQKLLDYMGDTLNGYAPFKINFPRKLTTNLHWMNKTILKCNESFFDLQNNRTANPCSCLDCTQSSCPARQNESTNDSTVIRLVIRPTHPVPTGYHRFGDEKWIPFGPIFHLDLLNKALHLQNKISNMRVPFGSGHITLEDICYQPLAPQKHECTIPSIFQYFQNNNTRLNKCLTSMGDICNNETLTYDFKAYDFHDHILLCTRSPLSYDGRMNLPCRGAYGKAVMPYFVLRGFNGTNYKDASTLIITFLVNNFKDQTRLEKALAWEQAFVNFMRDYVNNPENENLTISYSAAERSIQDEMEHHGESNTDIDISF